MISNPSIIPILSMARVILSSLPFSGSNLILKLFDFGFNLIAKTLANNKYMTGAYGIFGITPGSLLVNSPLLAKIATGFSFPSHPVKMQFIKISVVNTAPVAARTGRWAAVYIPYREVHDSKHYESVKDFTFNEVCAMPHSKSGPVTSPLTFNYRMRDKTDYCARPREITEEIGLFLVIWDSNSANPTAAFDNSSFNCEVEISGRCTPHVIFGPAHRVNFLETDLDIKARTKGDSVRIHHECGRVELKSLTGDFEMM